MLGAIRASAPASARATAVRLRNASTVMPERHLGEAGRRQRRRAPDHEVGRAERGVLADEDLAGVDEPVDDDVDVGVAHGDLEVLGGEAVGDRDRLVEVDGEHAAAVRTERGPRRVGPHGRQVGELAGQLGVRRRRRARSTSSRARRTSRSRARPRSAGRRPAAPGRRRRRRSRGSRSGPSSIIVAVPWRCSSTWAQVTAGDPGPTILRTAGIDAVPNAIAARPAGPLARNTSPMPELAAHDQHGRVDGAAAARHRWHDEHDRAARRRRSRARRAGRRRSGSSPSRTARTGRPT